MNTTTLLMVLVLVAGPLRAEPAPNAWVGLLGGWDWQSDPDRGAQAAPVVGLSAGVWCTPRWGGDLSVLATRLRSPDPGTSTPEYHAQVSVLYNLLPDNDWTPYVRAGLGGSRLGTPFSFTDGATQRFSYHGGFGVQATPAEHLLIGLEARVLRIETQVSYDELVGLFTLGYQWGVPARGGR
jgi:hypothetical protein